MSKSKGFFKILLVLSLISFFVLDFDEKNSNFKENGMKDDTYTEISSKLKAQMDNASALLNSKYIWDTLNLTGNSNASIALLGTGIDDSHFKFGKNSYDELNFSSKIIGWNDTINPLNSNPFDPNGQGTFIASTAFGTNNTITDYLFDSQNRTSLTLGGSYFHPAIFENWTNPGIFNLKIGSFYIDSGNVNVTLNGCFDEYSNTYIKSANFCLYNDGILIAETTGNVSGEYKSFDINVTDNFGVFDVIFKYQLGFADPANFSVNTLINYTMIENFSQIEDFSGLTPDSKIYYSRIFNEKKEGQLTDIISALEWINTVSDIYHIVAVAISIGSINEDTDIIGLNNTIDLLLNNGIMVIIAAGDKGIKEQSLYRLAQNQKTIIVGSVNQFNQLTSYSSKGLNEKLGPSLLAPGGSNLNGHRGIIAADSNDIDGEGYYTDQVNNDYTYLTGSSISSSFVAAAYNLLIEAIGGYDEWKNIKSEQMVLNLKSYLLMTASETNSLREDNPYTILIDESQDSPILDRGNKDLNEGFGLLNIDAAIEALNVSLLENSATSSSLSSASSGLHGKHVFSRRVTIKQNQIYQFDLSYNRFQGDLDAYLYYNESDSIGEPILIKSSNDGFTDFSGLTVTETFYFGTSNETREFILVIKAISGNEIDFDLEFKSRDNLLSSQLSHPEVSSLQDFNDTMDQFFFTINYTDEDDIPPISIYINVSGLAENLTLHKQNDDEFTFSNGCNYTVNHRFYTPGNYTYHFGVFDGNYFTRYPTSTDLPLEIYPISDAIYGDYEANFSSLEFWELGNGWNNLTQNSSIDYRGIEMENEWNFLYFGDKETIESGVYDYNSIPASGEFITYTPHFWIVENSLSYLNLGMRVSINQGDNFDIELKLNRTGDWILLDSFSDVEDDWQYYKFNLSNYDQNYAQIRFRTVLDLSDDIQKNKGVMIDKFSVIHNPSINYTTPIILNTSTIPHESNSQDFSYFVDIGDLNGNIPEVVYLEIEGKNRSMINYLGDWNASYYVDFDDNSIGGMKYSYSICLANISNTNFTVYIYSGGEWYSSDLIEGPTITNNSEGIYPFENQNTRFCVYGDPEPETNSLWISSGNSFHYIQTDHVWYAGEYDYRGYGNNWNINLLSDFIYIPLTEEELKTIYLWLEHKIIFDNGSEEEDYDYGAIYLYTNNSQEWSLLREYSDPIEQFRIEKINLNAYRGQQVKIKFNFHSDDVSEEKENSGWSIKNIYVKIDELEDITSPTIEFLDISSEVTISGNFTLNIYINDDFGLDYDSLSVFIGTEKIMNISFVNNTFSTTIDTSLFSNGNYEITVKISDLAGNSITKTITVTLYNFKFPWYIVWSIIAFLGISIICVYLYYRQKMRNAIKEATMHLLRGIPPPENSRGISKFNKTVNNKANKNVHDHRVREEAEMATKESEEQKLYNYKCKSCNSWFKNNEFAWNCPNCKKDSLFIAYHCKICNKWYFKEEPGEHFCKTCKVRLLK